MFLKRKICGKIKGRRCADGRPHRDYMSKQDTASPTFSTEALLLSCLIDTAENRHIVTCDIPGTFMQSNMKNEFGEKVTLKLEGLMAQILLNISPSQYEELIQN